jgi:1-phosphofructokinase family hexose kinase
MFLTIGLNPVIQRTYLLPEFEEDKVNRCRSYRVDASGKGTNVTRVLQQLGEAVVHLTHLGGRQRDYFLEMARLDGLQIEWVESQSEIRTCCTLLNELRHTSTEIVEEAEPIAAGTEEALRARYTDLCRKAHAVIISGTAAAGYSTDLLPWMVRTAKENGLKTLLDYRGRTLLDSLPFCPDVIKPNRQEFMDTFFLPGEKPQEQRIVRKMIELAEKQIQVILTNGAEEVLYTGASAVKRLAIAKLVPVNTIGCGDAFTAGVASGWLQSGNLEASIEKGIWAAGQNACCLKPGSLV